MEGVRRFAPWREVNGTRVRTSEANWKKPLKWNREAASAGRRDRVFCASVADVFEDWTWQILRYDECTLWTCCGRVIMKRVGKKRAGRLLDGVEHNGFPVPKTT